MSTTYLSSQEYAARRSKVFDRIGPRSVALVQGAGHVGGYELFRQTNEFYYLTGVEVPQAYLMLDGRTQTAAIYLQKCDAGRCEPGDGCSKDACQIKDISGVEDVRTIQSLDLGLAGASTVFVAQNPAEQRFASQDTLRYAASQASRDPWDGAVPRESLLVQQVCRRLPEAEIANLSPILDDLRLIKSEAEIDIMRRASTLSAASVAEAMRCTRAGLYEYHLGAVADFIYRSNGAASEAYRAIIASGPNIWGIHYQRNDSRLTAGDLVLMDYAPEIAYYTSDIGRMWPVNGAYSPLQRELYGFMLEYHKAVLASIRPGAYPRQILDEAAQKMRRVANKTRFSGPQYEEAALRTLDFKGHLSHPVGMAVHDPGKYFERPLEPGLVISVDPQMWVPSEKLYIRVEDTVVVTTDGVEVLTRDAPLDLDHVEATMRETGIIERLGWNL